MLKKILVSRNELREFENIGARDVDVLIANFLLQVREFLFLICVKKRMLLIPGTGNRERESGNKFTAATLLRVQNGGQNKRKGSKRNNLS